MSKRPSPFGSQTLVSAEEISEFLGCSPKHVRRLAQRGQLPKCIKIGRLCRWPRREIEAWLEDRLSAEAGRS